MHSGDRNQVYRLPPACRHRSTDVQNPEDIHSETETQQADTRAGNQLVLLQETSQNNTLFMTPAMVPVLLLMILTLIPCQALPPASMFSHLSWSIIDTASRLGRAASLIGLTRINGHAHASIPTVSIVTGTQVLVWTGVEAGGLSVTDLPETRVYGWERRRKCQRHHNTDIFYQKRHVRIQIIDFKLTQTLFSRLLVTRQTLTHQLSCQSFFHTARGRWTSE